MTGPPYHAAMMIETLGAARDLAALPWIVVPRVHWACTRTRVNVQDFIGGVAGHHPEELDRQGFDRRLLARRGAQAVLKMIVEDGLFHADPHPGNVFYLPGNRIAFIDFGMVGRLAPRRRGELLTLLLGLVQRDAQAVADVLLDWTGDAGQADIDTLEAEIEGFVEQYHGVALVIAALIVGSSIVMTVEGGPSLFGLPAFGFMGFCGAVLGGLWLVRSIRRSQRQHGQ